MSCCYTRISRGFASLIAISGLLLGLNGFALVGLGSSWDSLLVGADYLYVVNDRHRFYDSTEERDYPVLLYQGLVIALPVIPAILQLCKRVRSMTILFLLSVLPAFVGSVFAAVLSGIAWRNVAVIYRSYSAAHCEFTDYKCSCTLFNSSYVKRTADVQVSHCDDIATLHFLINIYFALAITAAVLSMGSFCTGVMVSCGDAKERRLPQASSEPAYNGTVSDNPIADVRSVNAYPGNHSIANVRSMNAYPGNTSLLSVPGSSLQCVATGSGAEGPSQFTPVATERDLDKVPLLDQE